MRKFVWAGTAVVVMCAAAVYLAADYAARYPHSWFGRYASVAGYIGSYCNPFAGLGASLAHQTPPADEPQVCEAVLKPKPDAGAQEQQFDVGDVVNEPIKVEPQYGFIVPFDPEETSVVPPSEETPEPSFGPEEESEYPSPAVTASAGEEEEAAPPAMPYVEDDPPACPKCGKCTTGCCAKGTCTKRGVAGCCEKGNCCKKGATSCCDESTCTKCGTGGCCAEGCCGWFMSFFGMTGCGTCGIGEAAKTPIDCYDPNDIFGQIKELSTDETTPKDDASKSDDVPNAQEDPTYHQQYPSCPYTGCPSSGCPYPYYNHSPVTTPPDSSSDETPHPKKKRKKTAATSQLRTHVGDAEAQEQGDHLDTPAATSPLSPIKPVKKTTPGDAEESEAHPEVDTMEARPTDLERDPFATEPF